MRTDSDSPLERYFRLLECIAMSPQGLSVSGMAESCALPVGTTHRLIQNLYQAGLVETVGDRRKDYQLGQRLLRLLYAGNDEARLAITVQPILDTLADRLHNTCYLVRLVGHKVTSVAWAAPSDGLQGYVIPGQILPPHVAASAKAILAFQPQDILDAALAGPFPKLAPETLTDRKDIERDYALVREQGFATCWNEMEIGIGAIAVPISLPHTGVIYSLGTSGLIDRLKRRTEQQTVEILHSAVPQLVRAIRGLSYSPIVGHVLA